MSLDLYIYDVATEDTDVEDIEVVRVDGKEVEEVFWINITHNLGRMAAAAGIYHVLWRPGYEYTKITPTVVDSLERGYSALLLDPEKFKEFDAPNGWGVYKHFVPFVREVLEHVRAHPNGWIYRSV